MVIIGLVKIKIHHPVIAEIMEQNGFKSKCKISKVDVTEDTLTGRGGIFRRNFFKALPRFCQDDRAASGRDGSPYSVRQENPSRLGKGFT